MPSVQPAFFDDDATPQSRARDLLFRPQPAAPLSKLQQQFNRLVKKIERLRGQLDADRRRFDEALAYHAQHVRPRIETATRLRKDLIRALRPFLDDRRLTPRDRRELHGILRDQLDDVLASSTEAPDEELRALFERLWGANLDEVAREQMEEARGEIEAALADAGLDVDLSGLRIDMSEEERAASMARIADDLRRQAEERSEPPASRPDRMRTGRQRREENEAARLEAIRKDGLAAIYRRLAKALHPDLEPDPALREEKGVLMQEVTTAYAAGDLHALLRLELEWIHQEQADLSRITDEKLGAYNALLKEQAAALEDAVRMQPLHPRYAPLVVEDGWFGTVLRTDGAAEAKRLDGIARSLTSSLERMQTRHALNEVRTAIRMFRQERRFAD
jgi:hypothetical protein